MSTKLPDHTKSLVIQQWLQGVQRDLIAANNGVSAGAVTNVVNEWRRGLGSAIIDDLRELGVTFRKVGITPAQCALGFRIAMMIAKLGVKKEDDLEPFILHVYNNCIDLGVSPDNVASHIKDLLEFSKNTNNNAVPLSQISDFIQQKTNEKKKLEQEIQTLKDEIKTLNEEKLDSEHRRASALYEENMTAVELKSYSDLKEELGQYGIPIHDVSKFAKAVLGISQKGYDVGKVIEEFSELESTRSNYWDYKDSIPDLKIKYDGLNQEYSKLEQSVNSCKQKLSLNNELQAMGFGIKELKLLRNTIKEIADANNIPPDQAQQKFYKDIEEQYDDKLGFESQLNKLRSEIATVSNNLTFLRTATVVQPLVGPSLQRLFSKGLSEQDIVELANIFERSHSDSSNDIDDDKNSSSSSSTGIDKQSLTGLQKYGGKKLTVIQELNQQADKLRNQIDELQTYKKDLEEQNQSMLSILAYSQPVVEFFNRSDDDHSLGNDYDNVKILATIAIILYILYIRYEGVGKLVTGEHKELMPLSMAVASGGNVQAIPIPQLKTTIAKALEILIAKLDTKPQPKEDLVVQGSTSSINNQQYNSKNV
jgi:predicted  nucleic acid-binding Zn-ribbon protein